MKAFQINFLLQIKLYENPQGKGCSQEEQTQKKLFIASMFIQPLNV